MKRLMMIAGPNGAGKTTISASILDRHKDLYEDFLNADKIAAGLSPLNPESVNLEAGKLMIQRFHHYVEQKKSFVFETTGANLSFAQHLKNAKKIGYEINLLFVWIASADQAVQRVAQRVKQGGHNIPELDIRRRYSRGLKNLLTLYLPIADTALIVDNSSIENRGNIIAKKEVDTNLCVIDVEIWKKIESAANG